MKFSGCPSLDDSVDIFDHEKSTRKLEEMVEAMKGAVAMAICVLRVAVSRLSQRGYSQSKSPVVCNNNVVRAKSKTTNGGFRLVGH